MNQKTPYELQIADKLQQLPLPDLQDAIWARIERTLDIDMPTNDDDGGGGDGGPGSGPGAPWWGSGVGGFVFSMVFVAALTTFVIIQSLNPSTNNGPARDNSPSNQYILPNSQEDRPPPGTTALPARNPATQRTNTPVPIAGDSVLGNPLVTAPPPAQDTAAATIPTAIVPPPVTAIQQPAPDTTPTRRRRGVPVNPNDYRIVPRADSSRQ
jgi:hypothetical protein